MNYPEINFDAEKVRALRRAYKHAVETQRAQFVFEGHELQTAYAKYLLEYLSLTFPPDAP